MRTDNICIKQRNRSFLLYGFCALVGLLAGIFLVCMRFLDFGLDKTGLTLTTVAGTVLILVCLILYGLIIYRAVKQKDALILTNRGFTNMLVGGKEGVYVEWTAVKSLRIYGLKKSPMLGITLNDNTPYFALLSGKDLMDAQANAELDLPVISIQQRDVLSSIEELKNLFSRMVKGAISWENYTAQRDGRTSQDMTHTIVMDINTPIQEADDDGEAVVREEMPFANTKENEPVDGSDDDDDVKVFTSTSEYGTVPDQEEQYEERIPEYKPKDYRRANVREVKPEDDDDEITLLEDDDEPVLLTDNEEIVPLTQQTRPDLTSEIDVLDIGADDDE